MNIETSIQHTVENSPVLELAGKKGLILGIANAHSIAYGCGRILKQRGASLAMTYLNDKARPHVEPLSQQLQSAFLHPCDVSREGELERVFEQVDKTWGELDFLIHSIAWSPLNELHGRLLDTSAEGFMRTMDISCHSFIRCARLAAPLMKDGGSLLTMSYQGSTRVVDHYNLMGPVKAALESSVRYLAAELGPQRIRVNAISPGPVPTRAASGIEAFDHLMEDAAQRSPLHRLVTLDEIGGLSAFLISPLGAGITGSVIEVDGGHHIVG